MTEEVRPSDALLPPYLREAEHPSGHVYGTLSYNRRSKMWVVKGDPSVTGTPLCVPNA